MSGKIDNWMDAMVQRRALARWRAAAETAETLDPARLRALRGEARQLQRALGQFTHVADGRLALPMIGSSAMRKPASADWAWRPGIWRGPLARPGLAAVASETGFGDGATLFHDCTTNELSLRQIRNRREADLAPYGLRLDVFRFDGSFLSLVLELPAEAAQGLTRRHVIRMDATVEKERPLEIFARLNVKHGPNVEQIVRELPRDATEVMIEFDLAYTKMNEKRVDKLWVDLIFEGPEMNQVTWRDVTFCRRPRADL
ncbi:DUF6478 family protein [Acidimangrovimonas pyrenivorans]|uniref:DUF6478 family protein n=1 Tax=Acidimangrovimonas pyrenivorans TaxID=2030798 RepID=A0ABV7AD02_9RHOB